MGDEDYSKKVEPIGIPLVPFLIDGISEGHSEVLFQSFEDVVNNNIQSMQTNPKNHQYVKFLKYLLQTTDLEKFKKLQFQYLSDSRKTNTRLKYIHPIHYFRSKMMVALRLELDKEDPIKILDIGTGAGHFPAIASFFGHEVIGMDFDNDFYNDLCDVYNVNKWANKIETNGDIPELESGPVDFVTGFMTAFNIDDRGNPWTTDTWDHFFDRVSEKWLVKGGRIFLQLSRGKMSDESWKHLEGMAECADKSRKEAMFQLGSTESILPE